MKSKFYEDMKNEYTERFLGKNKRLKDFRDWFKQTNCPLSNRQLLICERNMKLDTEECLTSNGSLGTKSIIYYDKKLKRFVGFQHIPFTYGKLKIQLIDNVDDLVLDNDKERVL